MGPLKEESVGLPKFGASIVREEGHVGDMGFFRESFLCKGGIDAHGHQFDHPVEAFVLLAQIMGLLFAHGGVERRHDANDPDLTLALGVGEGDRRQDLFTILIAEANTSAKTIPIRLPNMASRSVCAGKS